MAMLMTCVFGWYHDQMPSIRQKEHRIFRKAWKAVDWRNAAAPRPWSQLVFTETDLGISISNVDITIGDCVRLWKLTEVVEPMRRYRPTQRICSASTQATKGELSCFSSDLEKIT